MKTTRDFIGECESCGLPCYYANAYCSNICEKNAQYEAKFGDRESTPDDDFTLPTFEDIKRYPASPRQSAYTVDRQYGAYIPTPAPQGIQTPQAPASSGGGDSQLDYLRKIAAS